MKNRHRFIIVVGICLLGLALTPPAQAVYFNFTDFADTSDFLLIKQAQGIYDYVNYSPGRHVLRLTRTAMGDDTVGVAWLQNPVTLATDYSFTTTFQFRLHEITAGADGFTFVVQTAGVNDTMWGGAGGWLGYAYNGSPGQTRIAPSVAVEFDTWSNCGFLTPDPPYWDPNLGGYNHMGIDWNGDFQNTSAFPTVDLNSGDIWQAWIEYDGNSLQVWVGSPGERPETTVLDYTMNLAEILETNQVYLGFTASYSGDWQHHDILSWQFSSEESTLVPAPSTILLLGTGLLSLLGLGVRQRRR